MDSVTIILPSSSVSGITTETQPLPPTNIKQLSGLHTDTANMEENSSASFLREASFDLNEAMTHLKTETQNTEKQIQRSTDLLWQRMKELLEQQRHQMGRQLEACQEELATTRDRLSRMAQQEAALVQQSAKMSVEAVMEEKRRRGLEAGLAEARAELASREAELVGTQRELKGLQESSRKEVEGLQADLKEKAKVVKEYQDKISKLTEKMKELTKSLSAEKETAEKASKATSEQVSHQTSENRKMALEISKLKTQLSSSSSALTASKEEAKKLETELANTRLGSEAARAALQGQCNATVKALEKRITELETEIELLKNKHQSETAQMIQELSEMKKIMAQDEKNNDDADGLDARIRFLQHQNREEKKKLEIGKKPQKYMY